MDGSDSIGVKDVHTFRRSRGDHDIGDFAIFMLNVPGVAKLVSRQGNVLAPPPIKAGQ